MSFTGYVPGFLADKKIVRYYNRRQWIFFDAINLSEINQRNLGIFLLNKLRSIKLFQLKYNF